MIFEEKEVTLKNGETAVFKTPEIEDAEKLLTYIATACGETPFLARYPEEWAGTAVEQEEKWIEGLRTSSGTLDISCFIGGKVVGNCELSFHSGLKDCHRATVAIAILRDHWNKGIGSAMFCEMTAAAKNRGIEIMELEFIGGNERAKHLYEKFGFKTVCEKPNAFKFKDGTYHSEFHMQKYM